MSKNNLEKSTPFIKFSKKPRSKLFAKKLKKTNLTFSLTPLIVSKSQLSQYDIVTTYPVGDATVYITTDKHSKMDYLISEPPIDKIGIAIYGKIMNYLYLTLPSNLKPEENSKGLIKEKVVEISKLLGIYDNVKSIINPLNYYIQRDTLGYGIIDVPMKDPEIEDISEESFAKPVGISHRTYGQHGMLDTNIIFQTIDATNLFVQKLVQKTGKSITAAVPYIDTMSKEGHRIAATFGREISLPGPNFVIRKFSEEPFTITKLIEVQTLNPLMAAYIWTLMDSKAFLLVIGSTAAGKTTTIGALSTLIHPQMKITTIEDTPELMLGHSHWQRLVTRKSAGIFEARFDVDMDNLIKLSLRSRPDYVIVGEVRGEEISSLIQAAATGHGGLTSFHATDADSALVRMHSPPMNVHQSGQMMIWAMIRQNRLVDAEGKVTRRITNISEIIPTKEGVETRIIMGWDASTSNYFPQSAKDIVKKSYRLKEIAIINGWDENEIVHQIESKAKFLQGMLDDQKIKFSEVTTSLARYHYEKYPESIPVNQVKKSEIEYI